MRGDEALIMGLCGLLLGGCVAPFPPPAGEGGSETGDTGSTGPGTTTTTTDPSTTIDSLDGTSSSTGEPGSSSAADSGSSTGEPPQCRGVEDCGSNQDCAEGVCVDACGGAWGEGNYGGCLDAYGVIDVDGQCGAQAQHRCISYGSPIEATHCAAQGCMNVCDCPAPPATGDAIVTCGNITFPDRDPDCYLSCANGETCPDGMFCRGDAVCATAPSDLPAYGDCGNVLADCTDGTCLMLDGHAVCVTPCESPADCDPAPDGMGSEDCNNIGPPPGPECVLQCNENADCPAGMACVEGPDICMWPA